MINNHLDPYGYMIPEIFYDAEDPAIPIINDGSTVAWFRSDAPVTITSVANRVSRWNDYLGSGHDLIQANGADQPLWGADGILFDGVSEYMKAAAFTFNQPEMIYMVIKQVAWNHDVICDGNVNNSGAFYQEANTPGIKVYAGIFSTENDNLAVNTWGIIRVLFNGASSKLIINETTPTTGNFGALNMGGFTLGALGGGGGDSNIEVKEIILRNVADGAADEAIIYAYLSAKYGI